MLNERGVAPTPPARRDAGGGRSISTPVDAWVRDEPSAGAEGGQGRAQTAVTDLAQVMQRRPRAYLGYYHWEIFFLSSAGDVRLPVGYERTRPIPVRRYLEDNPRY